jgi:hypothetical protein
MRGPLALALLCLAAGPAAASAQAAERIDRGRSALAALEYEAAAAELMDAAADPEATDEQRLEAHLLAGIAHRVIGRDIEAAHSFRYVLWRRIDAQLPPDTSPKIGALFEVVRAEVAEERAHLEREAEGAARARPVEAPAPAAAAEGGGLRTAGLAVSAAGAVALGAGVGLVLFMEAELADPSALAEERAAQLTLGRAGLVGAVAGAAALLGGGGLALLGWLE